MKKNTNTSNTNEMNKRQLKEIHLNELIEDMRLVLDDSIFNKTKTAITTTTTIHTVVNGLGVDFI